MATFTFPIPSVSALFLAYISRLVLSTLVLIRLFVIGPWSAIVSIILSWSENCLCVSPHQPGFNTVSSLVLVRLFLLYFTSQHRVLLYFTAQLRVPLYFSAHLRLCSATPLISASALQDDSSGAWLPLCAPHPWVLQTGQVAHFSHDEALEGPGAGPSSGPQRAGQVRLRPGRALL